MSEFSAMPFLQSVGERGLKKRKKFSTSDQSLGTRIGNKPDTETNTLLPHLFIGSKIVKLIGAESRMVISRERKRNFEVMVK